MKEGGRGRKRGGSIPKSQQVSRDTEAAAALPIAWLCVCVCGGLVMTSQCLCIVQERGQQLPHCGKSCLLKWTVATFQVLVAYAILFLSGPQREALRSACLTFHPSGRSDGRRKA